MVGIPRLRPRLPTGTALDHATPLVVPCRCGLGAHVNTPLRGRQLPMGSVLVEAAGPTTAPVHWNQDAMALALHTRIPAAVTAAAARPENWLLHVVSVLLEPP